MSAQVLWDDFTYRDAADAVTDSSANYPFIEGDSGFVADFNLSYQSKILRPALKYVGTNELSLGRPGSRLAVSYGAEWQRESEVDLQAGDFGVSRNEYAQQQALFTEPRRPWPAHFRARRRAARAVSGLPVPGVAVGELVVALVPDRFGLRAARTRSSCRT